LNLGAKPKATAKKIHAADLENEITKRVDSLVKVFHADRYKDRRAAAEALLSIHDAYIKAMTDRVDDPKARNAILATLKDSLSEAAIASELAHCRKEQREKLLKFRRKHPDIFMDMFSLNWRRQFNALKKIRDLKDTEALAEPIVVDAMSHPCPQVADEALSIAATGRYRSDKLVDALCKIAFKIKTREWTSIIYSSNTHKQQRLALLALKAIRSRRAAPTILAMILEPDTRYNYYRYYRDSILLELLVDTGEKRAIPHLLEALHKQGNNSKNSWRHNNKRVTWRRKDTLLIAVIRLSGQDPSAYGIVQKSFKYRMKVTQIGFYSEKDRTKAVKRINDWWAKHKDTPPYNKLEPLVLPELPSEKQKRLKNKK